MSATVATQRSTAPRPRAADTPQTLAESVYQEMRGDILGGQFAPGDRLRLAELTDRYGCSMTVVREGLNRLAAQGLVGSAPQHGFHVTPLSVGDLLELTEARCEIEGRVLALSVEHGDLGWESNLVAAHHAMGRTGMRADGRLTEAWTEAHSVFHAALLAGCPNTRMLNIALALRDSAELYRQWGDKGDVRDIASEHHALLQAALDRDAQRASALLLGHLRSTADGVLRRLAQQT